MRAGGAMPGMSAAAAPGREEQALLAAPGRDAAIAAVVIVLTAGVFVAVGDHGTLASVQRWDDAWLRLMISGRAPPLTAIARILNVLGLVYVAAGAHRHWRVSGPATEMVASRGVHRGRGGVRGLDRRAEGNLRPGPAAGVAGGHDGASFPSGHAVATSVTAVAAVIALVPPGRRRAWWGVAAVTFSVLMGLSRAYLAAHWLSDAVAGVLLGTSCALTAALVVGLLQRWWQGTGRRPAGSHRMAGISPPDEVAGRRRTV